MRLSLAQVLIATSLTLTAPAVMAQDSGPAAGPNGAAERAPQSAKKKAKHKHRKGHHRPHRAHR